MDSYTTLSFSDTHRWWQVFCQNICHFFYWCHLDWILLFFPSNLKLYFQQEFWPPSWPESQRRRGYLWGEGQGKRRGCYFLPSSFISNGHLPSRGDLTSLIVQSSSLLKPGVSNLLRYEWCTFQPKNVHEFLNDSRFQIYIILSSYDPRERTPSSPYSGKLWERFLLIWVTYTFIPQKSDSALWAESAPTEPHRMGLRQKRAILLTRIKEMQWWAGKSVCLPTFTKVLWKIM